jgi:hypothetical protein
VASFYFPVIISFLLASALSIIFQPIDCGIHEKLFSLPGSQHFAFRHSFSCGGELNALSPLATYRRPFVSHVVQFWTFHEQKQLLSLNSSTINATFDDMSLCRFPTSHMFCQSNLLRQTLRRYLRLSLALRQKKLKNSKARKNEIKTKDAK